MPDGGGGKGNLGSVSSPSVTFGATSPLRGRIEIGPSPANAGAQGTARIPP